MNAIKDIKSFNKIDLWRLAKKSNLSTNMNLDILRGQFPKLNIFSLIYHKPTTTMVLDSKQFQKNNIETTKKYLKEFNTTYGHIGINSMNEEIAELVGRKNHGKVRTQEELDGEIDGVLKFLKEDIQIENIKLDMLLTPFDILETIESIRYFYKEIFNAMITQSVPIPYIDNELE